VITKRNKFNAKKVCLDGFTFDSIKESQFYKELLLLKNANEPCEKVVHIEVHPRLNVKVKGKLVFFYKADFLVTYADGIKKWFDVKGLKKGSAYQYFKLKKNIIEAIYDIKIIEI
jgi:hypothetical protein